MSIVDEVTRLEAAFKLIAEVVGADPESLMEVVTEVAKKSELVEVYERAIRMNINILDARDMHELAGRLLMPSPQPPLPRPGDLAKPLVPRQPTEEHREKLRKAWATHDPNVTIIDTPFKEYAEEFVDYLAQRLGQLKMEQE